jgi:AcrR family transcriptional regulator
MPMNSPIGGAKEHIAAAATELFAQRGYDGTSMRHVARAANITLPTIYHYFTNKEGLYQYVLQQTRFAFVEAVYSAVTGEESVRDRLVAIGEAKHRFIAAHRPLMTLLMREQLDIGRWLEPGDQSSSDLTTTVDFMRALVQEGIATGELAPVDADMAAWCLAGVFTIYDLRIVSRGEPPAEGEVAQVVDLALEGLLPRESSRGEGGR